MLLNIIGSAVLGTVIATVFAKPKTALYVIATAALSYAVVLFSVVLLLVDTQGPGTDLTQYWRTVYWLQFLLSFIMLPFVIQFEQEDYISSIKSRVFKALGQVLKVYLLYAIIGLLALGIWTLVASNAVQFTQLCMTMGTIWGLVQISILMGYGLILLPHSFTQNDHNTSYDIELCRIDQYESQMQQCQFDIEYLIATAKGIKGLRLNHDTAMIDIILSKFPQELVGKVPGTVLSEDIEAKYIKSLASLHQASKQALIAQQQAQELLAASVTRATKLESLLKEEQYTSEPKRLQRVCFMMLSLLSVGMVLAEILANFALPPAGYFSGPILVFMVLVTFSGLFSLRIGSYYVLEVRNSLPASLLYSAKMLTSLAPALLFNFLKVCHISNTQYEDFMKRVSVEVMYLTPAIVVLVMGINQWGLWSRITTACGMEELALSTVIDQERLKAGRQKLFQLQKQRERKDDELDSFI